MPGASGGGLLAFVMSLGLVVGCEAKLSEFPENALAMVGDEAIDISALETARSELQSYGQARFRGGEGKRRLLRAVIERELLVHEAIEAGLENDPRVEWALEEEIAARYLAAEAERRMSAGGELDASSLQAWYEAHRGEFEIPEKRSMEAVEFKTLKEAFAALTQLRAGEAQLADFGSVITTAMNARDDEEFPAFHRILFDSGLKEGDWLSSPVLTDRRVMVGRVAQIEAARTKGLEAREVDEKARQALSLERRKAEEAQILAELREAHAASLVAERRD